MDDRIDPRVKKIMIVSTLVSFFVIAALYIYWSYPFRQTRTDAFFIPDAQFFTSDFQLPASSDSEVRAAIESAALHPILPVEFHWFRRGVGLVVAIRNTSESTLPGDARERFEKITIWTPRLRTGEVRFGSKDAIGYYSEGSSTELFDTCGGEIKEGQFTIGHIDGDSLLGRLEAEVVCVPLRVSETRQPRLVHLKDHRSYKFVALTQLTPWLGMRGSRLKDEVVRK